MDQLETTTSRLLRQMDDPHDLAYFLGEVLRAPMRGVPTVEDLEREQGVIGQPRESDISRQTGQDVLDWLTSAAGLAGILRGSAAGRQQELMGKQRGIETFGKEMMDTSRRAQPQKWREMEEEQQRAYLDPAQTATPWDYRRVPPAGRDSRMPPEEEIGHVARGNPRVPPDVVDRPGNFYTVGQWVDLPGGNRASYSVQPAEHSPGTFQIYLNYDTPRETRNFIVGPVYASIGEATAKARQLANRLDLAAKDMAEQHWYPPEGIAGERQVRLPWEHPQRPPRRLREQGYSPVSPSWWREDIGRPGDLP